MVHVLQLLIILQLKAKVSDFLVDGQWSIPHSFKVAFPIVVNQIQCVVPYSCIWKPYIPPLFFLNKPYIPLRRSVFCATMLQNRIAIDDNLRRCGMVLLSFCSMCRCSDEIVGHLFFGCSFAREVWRWLFDHFLIFLAVDGERDGFFKKILHLKMSPQIRNLWLSSVVVAMWGIWNQRNACKFENKQPNCKRLCY